MRWMCRAVGRQPKLCKGNLWLDLGYQGSAYEMRVLREELEEASEKISVLWIWVVTRHYARSFYTLKKSDCYPAYLSCTCPEGIKDNVCKDALLLMES
uniref:SWIM-type domain-containing protein n=1 Tax=Ditylenchus dipsaci TaxID=166011 RepID=A0A915DZC5_9BILA